MKNKHLLFVVFVLFFPFHTFSQNITSEIVSNTAPIGSLDKEQLHCIKAAVGNAQIVFLGRQNLYYDKTGMLCII